MPRNANRTNVSWAPAPPAFAIRNVRYSVEILRRPTANGLAYHHGMRISGDTVVDFDSRGAHFRSVADFGGGLPISILRRFPREEYSAIMRRLKIILSEDRPYHLANQRKGVRRAFKLGIGSSLVQSSDSSWHSSIAHPWKESCELLARQSIRTRSERTLLRLLACKAGYSCPNAPLQVTT